jgi:hypothetical protein
MKRLFCISTYPGIVVFALAGVFVVIFAFTSYNLLHFGMANLHFLQKHGLTAIAEGGLLQLLEILLYGAIALLAFIGFKLCESELVIRYRRWQDR